MKRNPRKVTWTVLYRYRKCFKFFLHHVKIFFYLYNNNFAGGNIKKVKKKSLQRNVLAELKSSRELLLVHLLQKSLLSVTKSQKSGKHNANKLSSKFMFLIHIYFIYLTHNLLFLKSFWVYKHSINCYS